MSDADKAFDAARTEILRVKETGNSSLDLKAKAYRALDRLPDEIGTLSDVSWIELDKTQITDLRPLAHLTQLTRLSLAGTPVSDIAPLSGLTALQTLILSRTQASDITPISGLTTLQLLNLNLTQVSDIAPLSVLTGLQGLGLHQTQVSDFAPLSGLTALQTLNLSQTQASDITPLSGLTALLTLNLHKTQVSDIAPLSGLTALQTLFLTQTQVSDLRPICDLPDLGGGRLGGLWFEGIPALLQDPELARLSEIEGNTQRTKDTQAHLRTLPPYPDPLPWEAASDASTASEGSDNDFPENHLAPLQVAEVDGVLRRVAPGETLEGASASLAQQGWAALRDYLDDLAVHEARIGNALPRLEQALRRLRAAMGDRFDNINAIAVGTHGHRVIRQSAFAQEALMEEDAADIEEFAAALTLFLDRFVEWRDYKVEAEAAAIDPDAARASVPDVLVLTEDMRVMPEVGAEVTDELEALARDVDQEAENPIVSKGMLASLSNVVAAMSTAAIGVLKTAKAELGDLTAKTWDESKTKISKGVGTAFGLAAAGFIIEKATGLFSLATRFSGELGWLQKFLQAFGLA